MSKVQKRNEFRKNKVNGHPAYIFAKIGHKFEYIGITHSDIDKKTGKFNILLECNPNPYDDSLSYVKPYYESLKENKFSKQPYKNWSFTKNDQQKINDIKKRTK